MKVWHSNINAFLYTPNKYFDIPDFQRPYSWTLSNISSFLEDIEKTLETGQVHYFGSIVYIVNGKESTIIDGQQRATTVLLMITAIYHLVKANPSLSSITAEQIKEDFLYNRFGDEENRIKLRTVTVDDQIFKKIFEQKILDNKDEDSKLCRAYKLFYDYFKNKTDLDQYIDILEKFEIVDISLENSDDNPQKIFESINSTGKPLTDGDKIRNFTLMLNDKESRKLVFENYWEKIEKELTDINQDYITDFFRNFLTGFLQKEVRLEKVYPEFKEIFTKEISDPSNLEELKKFYDTVLNYLSYYLLLKFNRDPQQEYSFIHDACFRINYLKIETPYPFLMKVLDRYKQGELSENDVLHIFKTIESYLTRRIVCNLVTTGLNKMFAVMDKDIATYQLEKPDEEYRKIFNYVLTDKPHALRFPQNSDIEAAISSIQLYTGRKYYVTFVLSSIDDKSQSRESFLLKKIATGDSKLSIEHIMPQNLNKDWMDELGSDYDEIHAKYVHTLPNLTLTGYNSKYSNRKFADKKTIENGFNNSPLIINTFIKKRERWDEKALVERAVWWVSQINDLWPIPTVEFVPPKPEIEISLLEKHELMGSKIKSVTVRGERIRVLTWAEAIDVIFERLAEEDEGVLRKIVEDEFLSKYVSKNSEVMHSPAEIFETGYFVETGIDTNRKLFLLSNLARVLNLTPEDLKAEILAEKHDSSHE
jgi:uncharacterized protein with ParB-like and HNH nuclease domain